MQTTAHLPLRPPLAFWLLIALLALCAGGKAILYDTLDPDLFWHLRVAQQLQHDGIAPLVDHISFASSRQPWTPYSWLAELAMKAIWDTTGFRGAVAAQALMQASIVFLLALACLELQRQAPDVPSPPPFPPASDPRYLAAVMATAAAAFITLPYLSFRPVTLAFVGLALCTWLILRDRRLHERSRAVWFIIPLTALLTNIHLFAFFIPGALLAMLVGAVLEAGSSIDPNLEKEFTRRIKRYGTLLAAAALAFLATPMLPGLIRTIFYYSSRDAMVKGPVIAEMQSFTGGSMGIAAALIVAGAITCLALHWRRIRLAEIICFLAGGFLLLKLGRFAPVYAMIMGPVLATTWPEMKDRILFKPALTAALVIILLLGTFRIAQAFPRSDRSLSSWLNRHGPDTPGYPTAAADYVQRSVTPTTGRIINEFSWGGYLAYALGDKYQILLDGRTQVYPSALWQATYLSDAAQRRQFLSTVTADAAILPAGKSQFRDALSALGWQTSYKDDRAEVMLPPTGIARIEP